MSSTEPQSKKLDEPTPEQIKEWGRTDALDRYQAKYGAWPARQGKASNVMASRSKEENENSMKKALEDRRKSDAVYREIKFVKKYGTSKYLNYYVPLLNEFNSYNLAGVKIKVPEVDEEQESHISEAEDRYSVNIQPPDHLSVIGIDKVTRVTRDLSHIDYVTCVPRTSTLWRGLPPFPKTTTLVPLYFYGSKSFLGQDAHNENSNRMWWLVYYGPGRGLYDRKQDAMENLHSRRPELTLEGFYLRIDTLRGWRLCCYHRHPKCDRQPFHGHACYTNACESHGRTHARPDPRLHNHQLDVAAPGCCPCHKRHSPAPAREEDHEDIMHIDVGLDVARTPAVKLESSVKHATAKLESSVKQQSSVKREGSVKVEKRELKIKREGGVKIEPGVKVEAAVKWELRSTTLRNVRARTAQPSTTREPSRSLYADTDDSDSTRTSVCMPVTALTALSLFIDDSELEDQLPLYAALPNQSTYTSASTTSSTSVSTLSPPCSPRPRNRPLPLHPPGAPPQTDWHRAPRPRVAPARISSPPHPKHTYSRRAAVPSASTQTAVVGPATCIPLVFNSMGGGSISIRMMPTTTPFSARAATSSSSALRPPAAGSSSSSSRAPVSSMDTVPSPYSSSACMFSVDTAAGISSPPVGAGAASAAGSWRQAQVSVHYVSHRDRLLCDNLGRPRVTLRARECNSSPSLRLLSNSQRSAPGVRRGRIERGGLSATPAEQSSQLRRQPLRMREQQASGSMTPASSRLPFT
ncbi:hypothetical protein B0H17DRAFT_1147528 [Mycena rosella]|uniref:Uncharacterized protein n=1 Tax=Mycena rosella TaxID=1033263 RepID=A0AAD7CLL0_MYCRO|nr:hypothetical protein B0H17DRAFT_1147528 [Mycena rosella]